MCGNLHRSWAWRELYTIFSFLLEITRSSFLSSLRNKLYLLSAKPFCLSLRRKERKLFRYLKRCKNKGRYSFIAHSLVHLTNILEELVLLIHLLTPVFIQQILIEHLLCDSTYYVLQLWVLEVQLCMKQSSCPHGASILLRGY